MKRHDTVNAVQVDVGKERRSAASLRRPLLTACPRPVFQQAGAQPFLDEPHDAPIPDAVLDELHQPAVVDGIEEPTDVHVEHPVHLPCQQAHLGVCRSPGRRITK